MERQVLAEAEITFVSWGEEGTFAYVPELEVRALAGQDEWTIFVSRDEEHGGWHIYRLERGSQVWEETTAADQFQVLFGTEATFDESDLDRILVALQRGGEDGWRAVLQGTRAVRIVDCKSRGEG